MPLLIEKFQGHFSDLTKLIKDIEILEAPSQWTTTKGKTLNAVSIMKASTFIVAYNSIEQAHRSALLLCRDAVKQSGLHYHQVSEHWRKDLIEGFFIPKLRDFTKPETIVHHIDGMFGEEPHGPKWLFSRKNIPGGNIDHIIVLDLFSSLDFRFRPPKKCRNGVELEIIKEKRNALAHGEERFSDVGAQYTTAQLKEMYGRAKLFVEASLRAIERYVSQRRFAIDHNAPHKLEDLAGNQLGH